MRPVAYAGHSTRSQSERLPFLQPMDQNTPSLFATSSSSLDNDLNEFDNETGKSHGDEPVVAAAVSSSGRISRWWQSIRSVYTSGTTSDGLTFRQRLAKMGLATVLSYGWVSNMSYGVSVSTAWYIFSKRVRMFCAQRNDTCCSHFYTQNLALLPLHLLRAYQTGVSPLAPGQWKGFLAVYAGFWVFNNIVRPIRLAVSVAVAPKFDAIVSWWQRKLNVPRGVAVGVVVLLFNVVGTISVMSLGIFVASLLAGVPVFPPKV
jgi:hypothetical protein